MKKLLGIVLSAAMLLSMAACGSTAASSAAPGRPCSNCSFDPAQQQILPLTLPLLPMQLPAT